MMVFDDRGHGGRVLAQALGRYAGRQDVVVLGLTRGGVPVASEVAHALGAPLDGLVVRKLGMPGHEELAFGAIAAGGARVLNDEVVRHWLVLGGDRPALERVEARERAELSRREALYRGGRPPLEITGKIAVVVDDGLATGATMRAAVASVRQRSPALVVVAVPVGAIETCEALEDVADDVVCARPVDDLGAVGFWYRDFSQTTDDEVIALLGADNTDPVVASG